MSVNVRLLEGLVVFVEVVAGGSFTAAAQSTGFSTSYISKEITKLEERLGVRLLHRTTRSLSLTPEGELYYPQCMQIIDDAQQIEDHIIGREQEPKGTLKVSCPIGFGLSQLRPVIAAYIARYSKVNIELELNDRKIDLVTEGFDVAIRASRVLDDSSLISRKFMQSQGLTLASPEYLSKHGTPAHPSELSERATISYSHLKNPTVWDYHDAQGKCYQVSVNSRLITNSPEMELSLCLAGQGITRLPEFNLTNELRDGLLVQLFPEFPTFSIGVYLVYPSRKNMSSKVRSFIDFVVEELGD